VLAYVDAESGLLSTAVALGFLTLCLASCGAARTSSTATPTSSTATSSEVASLAAGVAREEFAVNGGTAALLETFRMVPSVPVATAALKKLETALAKEESDARAKSAYVCLDADDVEMDAGSLVADGSAVSVWLSQVPAYAQDLRQGLGYLQADWNKLVRAEKTAHGSQTSDTGSNPADERAALQAGQHVLVLMNATVLPQVLQIESADKQEQSADTKATDLCFTSVSG
jgi:hypothetical protein